MEISEIEKQNIIRSLNEIKNGSEIIDYIEFIKSDCKIIGHEYQYEKEYEYDRYIGSVEVGEAVKPFCDSSSSCFFNTYILDCIDDFSLNIKDVIFKRKYCKAVYNKMISSLYSFNKGLLSRERMAFDIPNKTIRFHVGSDFEADEPNGLYVFDAEDCIESSCFENEDESLSYDININDKVVERFCVDSIESYYNIELYYCDEDFVVVG